MSMTFGWLCLPMHVYSVSYKSEIFGYRCRAYYGPIKDYIIDYIDKKSTEIINHRNYIYGSLNTQYEGVIDGEEVILLRDGKKNQTFQGISPYCYYGPIIDWADEQQVKRINRIMAKSKHPFIVRCVAELKQLGLWIT